MRGKLKKIGILMKSDRAGKAKEIKEELLDYVSGDDMEVDFSSYQDEVFLLSDDGAGANTHIVSGSTNQYQYRYR